MKHSNITSTRRNHSLPFMLYSSVVWRSYYYVITLLCFILSTLDSSTATSIITLFVLTPPPTCTALKQVNYVDVCIPWLPYYNITSRSCTNIYQHTFQPCVRNNFDKRQFLFWPCFGKHCLHREKSHANFWYCCHVRYVRLGIWFCSLLFSA